MEEGKKVFYEDTFGPLKIPVRSDGFPKLSDVQGFIEMNGFSSLAEMLSTYEETAYGTCSKIMLESAISNKKSEIALKLAMFLNDENISFKDAISILELAKNKIEESKFTI